MKYMGSKNRISKEILPIILKDRKKNQWYVEPFVGGANMIDKVDGKRIGSDVNEYLIKALKIIKNKPEILPKNKNETNEEIYKKVKTLTFFKKGLTGYYGFALSYAGKWFGGWCRDSAKKRDYVDEAYRNAIKQSPKLKGIKFKISTYDKLKIPKNSIIYCDPPYKGATGYKNSFDHSFFWQWCRKMSKKGHKVFISEYNAPGDFKSVWVKQIVSSLTKQTGSKKGTEKLFIFGGDYVS